MASIPPPPKSARCLAVIPARNEGASVAEVVAGVRQALACDVLVIDDASSDDTRARAAEAGAITWHAREYESSDLDDAWYALALTDSPLANAAIVADAEARHTYCVRADRADEGSAWTPATGDTAGVTVAAITSHDPLRARRVRDRFLEVVNEEAL